MMLYPAMSVLNSYIPNRYMLVTVVSRRARQIAEEAEANGTRLDEKPVTMAINEVAGEGARHGGRSGSKGRGQRRALFH